MEQLGKWGSLGKGVGLEITDAVDQGANSYMPGIFSFMHTESTDAAQVNFTEFTDFTGFGYRNEGENAKKQERYKGFDTSYIVDNFSGQVDVTVESIRRNQIGNALNAAEQRGRDAMRFKDKLGYQLLNAGFDNNNREKNGFKLNWFGDGKPQFSVQHPSAVPGGSTQSNASSTNLALASEDNLHTAWLALEYQAQDNGQVLDLAGDRILAVPLELQRTARVITESEKKAGTDYNDVNIYNDGTFNIMSSKYLSTINGGSATAWYLLDSVSHGLNYIEQGDIEIEEDYDAKNRVYNYLIHGYGTVASKGWKGSWGSKGTGAGSYTA